MCVCVPMHVCVCVWEVTAQPQVWVVRCHPPCFEMGFSLLWNCSARLTNKPQRSICESQLPQSWDTHVHSTTDFCSGPETCVTRTLPTELLPQPHLLFYGPAAQEFLNAFAEDGPSLEWGGGGGKCYSFSSLGSLD